MINLIGGPALHAAVAVQENNLANLDLLADTVRLYSSAAVSTLCADRVLIRG